MSRQVVFDKKIKLHLLCTVKKCTYIHVMITNVRIAKKAEKDLVKVPRHIVVNLRTWVRAVKLEGLENVRKIKGYHDEPLKGERLGQRSIRLSKAYRAIYSIEDGKVQVVVVEEVNKHEY